MMRLPITNVIATKADSIMRTMNHLEVVGKGQPARPAIYCGGQAYFETHLGDIFKQTLSYPTKSTGKSLVVQGKEYEVHSGYKGQRVLHDGERVVGVVRSTAFKEPGRARRSSCVYSIPTQSLGVKALNTGDMTFTVGEMVPSPDGKPVYVCKDSVGLNGDKAKFPYRAFDLKFLLGKIPRNPATNDWKEMVNSAHGLQKYVSDDNFGRILSAFYDGLGREALRFGDTDAFVDVFHGTGLLETFLVYEDAGGDEESDSNVKKLDMGRTYEMIQSLYSHGLVEKK